VYNSEFASAVATYRLSQDRTVIMAVPMEEKPTHLMIIDPESV
jgi:hypothetical protein